MVGDNDLDIKVESFLPSLLSVRPVEDRLDLGGFGRRLIPASPLSCYRLSHRRLVISDRIEMTEGEV
jgi:hypothetical protein